MNPLHFLAWLAATTLICLPASAQETVRATKVGTGASSAREWSFYASAFGTIIPDGQSYLTTGLAADRKALHIEARYNYENLETGSVWLGRTFSFGSKLNLELTPMIGGVFGRSNGVAPGFLASLEYGRLFLYSEGEYVFDTDHSESFFYNWSEVSYAPVEWFWAGVATQRTKAFHTKLDTQNGLLMGFSYRRLDFTGYVFNLRATHPTFMLAAGIRF